MISSALYVLYALAASAALVRGTTTATLAGAAVAVYLLLRLARSLRQSLAGRATAVAAPATVPAGPLPVTVPPGPGRP
ncbi:MAG TPA: hypothetical protein VKB14_17030 [Actinomycetales bacterium]|nr:hypothetical protein [Actinomycetales bacterium]